MSQLQERFERDGYLLGVPILAPPGVLQARATYQRLEDAAAAAGQKGRITNRHHDNAEIWQLATHPRVLETVEALIGPDIVLLSSGFFVKPPSADSQFVAWHQVESGRSVGASRRIDTRLEPEPLDAPSLRHDAALHHTGNETCSRRFSGSSDFSAGEGRLRPLRFRADARLYFDSM